MVEFVFALIILIISLPLMALLTIVIRIDSPGPAIFRQMRIGKDYRVNGQGISSDCEMYCRERRKRDLGGRPFTFYKFRTMVVDAKKRFPELYSYQYSPEELKALYFKVPEDPRLTRFGKHLRKTTLDELPNLFNVLKGDMSLIGPRPDIPEMLQYYEERHRKKFSVKPGITGLAQVNGRGLLTFPKTLEADVEYVERKNLWLDLRIILKTIKVTLFRIGAF
jgi:exopolysaccharide production protein ExoY